MVWAMTASLYWTTLGKSLFIRPTHYELDGEVTYYEDMDPDIEGTYGDYVWWDDGTSMRWDSSEFVERVRVHAGVTLTTWEELQRGR
jgi:hypothetical protein